MSRINQLIKDWPKGTIKTSKELKALGYNPQLLKIYANSKWISLVNRGAYKLYDDKVDWEGALYCLQKNVTNRIHVGGKTALGLKGYAHYLSQKKMTVDLFGNKQDKLPGWFKKQNWMKSIRYNVTSIYNYNSVDQFTNIKVNNIPVVISSPELAIMEMFFLVPQEYTFEEAALILESLTTLRAYIVQKLLEECNSIKVKRMFLYLSEKSGHKWFQELNPARINLGSGKRVIVKNGSLDKKYKITVPKKSGYEG